MITVEDRNGILAQAERLDEERREAAKQARNARRRANVAADSGADNADQAQAEADRLAAEASEAAARYETARRLALLQDRLDSDPEYAAAERRRRERIASDPSLDPRLKELFLDQTILMYTEFADLFEISSQQVYEWSAPRFAEYRDRPHPSRSPEPDVIVGVIFGKEAYGTQKGKLLEWGRILGKQKFDPRTGEMRRNRTPQRHGRPRSTEDPNISKGKPRRRKTGE